MSNDNEIALKINISGVDKNLASIKDIKDAMKELQNIVESSDIGIEQYKKAQADLEKLNTTLKEVTKTTAQLAKEEAAAKEATKANEESIRGLTQSLKGLINQQANVKYGTKEWHQLANAINETEGKIGDLQDGFATLKGSGVDRLNASVGLLKEGFTSFDTGKISTGFKGLGAAMSAIPIFLLIEGLTMLWENFDKVVEIAKSFTAEAKAQKAAIQDLNKSYGELAGNLDEISFREKEMIKNRELSTKIAIENAKQRGATEKEINQIEIQGNEEKLKVLRKAEENYRNQKIFADAEYIKALKTGDDEVIKKAEENLKRATDLYQGQKDKRISFDNEILLNKETKETDAYSKSVEAHKKHLEEKKTAEQKHLDELYQMHLAEVARFEQARKDAAEKEKQQKIEEQDALNQSVLDAEAEYQNDSFVQEQNANQAKEIAEAESLERRKQGYKQLQSSQLELTKQTLQSAQALTDLYFQQQFRMAKGNADRERELKKKQFNVNKAFGVANSIIDGVGAIQKALNNPYPLNIILAVLTGILATANTVKIATAKFDDGGASAGGGDVGGSLSTGAAPAVPQPNNTVTKIDDSGKIEDSKPKDQRVFVVETDITDKNKRVANIEETAKIK